MIDYKVVEKSFIEGFIVIMYYDKSKTYYYGKRSRTKEE